MPDEDAIELGARIRKLRSSHGQSLAHVARGTALTESFLSRLERGQTGVTVETLRRIAAFWDVEIVDLLARESGPKPLVMRSGAGPALEAEANGGLQARSETLIPKVGTSLQSTLYRTEKGGGRFEGFSHEGEEIVYVVSGAIRYFVSGQSYDLSAGDSIWHSSEDPHRWECPDQSAVTLHVNTPPTW
ncbi:helix-turn-helix domain-containing protein [Streptomyces griseus]|uniref:helix-turn-helix domain-containing protein n=1 Tax=Streptomyces griseus TaxID=1911 RepID=UPI003701B033